MNSRTYKHQKYKDQTWREWRGCNGANPVFCSDPSVFCKTSAKHLFSDTSGQSSCSEESLKYQTEEDCAKEEEAPEVPQELEKEQETEKSEMPYISKKSLNATEPKRQGYRLPRIRRNYTFNQTIENLHNGRPANSCVDFNPCESTKPDEGGDYQQWESWTSSSSLDIQERWRRQRSVGLKAEGADSWLVL